jgi:hypothetical protein
MKKIKWTEILFPLLTLLIGFLLSPIKSYYEKEFADLAAKKNISEITEQIEKVKLFYTAKIDTLREELNRKSEVYNRRRDIYAKIAKSTRVFMQGNVTNERKDEFLNNYSEIWLWAPDNVLKKINKFMVIQRKIGKGEKINQEDLKRTYTEFILEMRKDVGYEFTKLRIDEFQYFYFIN